VKPLLHAARLYARGRAGAGAAADGDSGTREAEADADAEVDGWTELLLAKAPMLLEYFSLGIAAVDLGTSTSSSSSSSSSSTSTTSASTVCITCLPQLCPQYSPPLAQLPLLLLRLATRVDWSAEEPCFEGVARAIAAAYAVQRQGYLLAGPSAAETDPASAQAAKRALLEHIIGEVVLPHMKAHKFVPPSSCFGAGALVRVAALEDLYKIFERC
jgi:hypothetical protein